MGDVRIYTAYDPPPGEKLFCKDKHLTRQSDAESCDINVIMARYEKSGVLPVARGEGVFADVSEFPTYQEVMGHIASCTEWFMQQPAKLRGEFNNDPAVFLDFISDPANLPAAEEKGLVLPPEKAVAGDGGAAVSTDVKAGEGVSK